MKLNFWELNFSQFMQITEIKSSELAQKLYRHLHEYENLENFNRLSELSPLNLAHLANHIDFNLPSIHTLQQSIDGTVKFLLKLSDGQKIETVLIPFHNKYSLCLSSQVGCAMNCSFCHTATQGLSRQLKPHEIVAQVQIVKNWCKKYLIKPNPLGRLVFMGQGEPLHNFDNVKTAITLLTQKELGQFGPRSITVSTSGYLPGLTRFQELGGVNLALSLHSAIDAIRTELIPLNRRYPLEQILATIKAIPRKKRQHIEYEYLLIDNVNDDEKAVDALSDLIQTHPGLVNLIPINPFQGNRYQRPSSSKIEHFKKMLVEKKIRVMERKIKGEDIMAACGQLHSNANY